MKRLFLVFALLAQSAAFSAIFDRPELDGSRRSKEFNEVSANPSIDSYQKVRDYCKEKYPGFFDKPKATSCFDKIEIEFQTMRQRAIVQWAPVNRLRHKDYPNSLQEFYSLIKEKFQISNPAILFDEKQKIELSEYFSKYEKMKEVEDAALKESQIAQQKIRDEWERAKKEDEARLAIEAEEKAMKEKARQAAAAEHKAALAAKRIAPSDFGEATVFYASTDAYDLATSPKIAADKKTYHSVGYIELTPDLTTFIARIKSGAEGIISPHGRQLMRELGQLSGRTKEPYFAVRVPPSLQRAYLENARMNKPMRVIGIYSGNTEITMTTNQTVKIPILDALFFDFGGDTMYGVGLPAPSRAR